MTIPRAIHQIWLQGVSDLENNHPEKYAWTRSVRAMHGFEHKIWSASDIEPLLTPELKSIWDAAPSFACQSDIGRLLILHRHGGLYLDIDYIVLKDFGFLLAGDIGLACVSLDTLRGPEKNLITINNAVIGAAPGSEIIEAWLQHIQTQGPFKARGSKYGHNAYKYTVNVTGYKYFNRLLHTHNVTQNPQIRVISNSMLEPLTLNNQHRKCNSHESCAAKFPYAYGIHLTDGSWLDKRIKMFGVVYGGLSEVAPGLSMVLGVVCLVLLVCIILMIARRTRRV